MDQEHRISFFRLPRCCNAVRLYRYDADFLFAVTFLRRRARLLNRSKEK